MSLPKVLNYRILIWSDNPDKLVEFYSDVLGFPIVKKYELIDDYGYVLQVTDSLHLWIGRHSDISGKNKEPNRHMFNFYVEDIYPWYNKIKSIPSIKIVADPFKTPPSPNDNPRYVFTFLDPEDNCLQFMNP